VAVDANSAVASLHLSSVLRFTSAVSANSTFIFHFLAQDCFQYARCLLPPAISCGVVG
jgi:hypothetical protein